MLRIIFIIICVVLAIVVYLVVFLALIESLSGSDDYKNTNYNTIDIYNQEGDYEYSYYELKDK